MNLLKKRFTVIFLLLFITCSVTNARKFYVATNGNNANNGTSTSTPWLSWQKAFTTAVAGDTVFFRGGVYYYSTVGSGGISGANSGTASNWICFFNYPGEIPVLDCSALVTPSADFQRAISVFSKSYIHFKGLTVRNVNQLPRPGSVYGNNYTYSSGIDNYSCHNLIYENMTLYNIQGPGLGIYGCNEILIKNCDVYNVCDYHAPNPGQNGTGFAINVMASEYGNSMYNVHIYVEGCRTWNFSDNGFAGTGVGYIEFKNCWSFNGGKLTGEGCGWKTGSGYGNDAVNPLCRLIRNCISANNGNYGFGENNDNGSVMNEHFYNNFAYHNGYKHDLGWYNSTFGVGFEIFDYSGSTPAPYEMFANNIAYANEYTNVWAQNPYIHQNNSWDQSVTVTNADFISLDTTQLRWPRQADGSLPEITFGKLASNSDLIDKGVNVGLDFSGSAPDLGYSESDSGTPSIPVYVSSSVENATPARVDMTYNLTLANIVPATSAFTVMVNSVVRSVNTVAISGTKVQLNLASPVVYGDIITVAYTKPSTNPIQTTSGGQATSLSTQTVTNRVSPPSPVYVSSSVENATPSVIEMTYNLTLANIVPATTAFTVMVNSAARTVSSVAISGTKVQLTLSGPVVYGNIVTVAYTKPSSNPLQTAAGGQAATISSQSVTNNVLPAVPVYQSSAIENATPAVLEMTYNLTLANIVPATSAFTVMVNSVVRSVNTVAISGTKVQLNLASPVVYGDIITVAYTKPSTNPIQTSSGGQAASLNTQSATNKVGTVSPVYVSSSVENAAPSVVEMTYNLSLANIVPATTAFTIMVNSAARTVSSVAISGTNVQLTLSSPIVYGDVVTIGYNVPSVNPLQTSAGGQASTISAQSVTNNVLPAVPAYQSSVIENSTPAVLEMTYNLTLANIVPATSAFTVMVNSVTGIVSSVAISGTKVQLTLSNPVVFGDVVTVAYTKPSSNPLQTTSGGQAVSFSAQVVTNNIVIGNTPPVIVVNYKSSSYSGFVDEINASGSYDANKDNLTYSWAVPNTIPVSSTTGSSIKYLGPNVNSPQTFEFTLRISDGKTTQSKVIPVEILPYKPELEVAEISNIEASSYQAPYYPYNIIDGNIGTMWSADGDSQWLILELKHSFDVQHVKLAFQPGQRIESYFDILGSVDKVTWEPILNKSASCAFSGDLQVFEFPSSKTGKEFDFIKLVGRCNSTDTWNYISELKIFGYRHRNSPAYEKLAVKIFPNPAKEHLTIRIDNSTLIPEFIQLIDLSGVVVLSEKIDPDLREFTIPVNLKNGTYIVKLGSGNLILFTQKLIIAN